MGDSPYQAVSYITVSANSDGQRIDNFLLRELSFLPKSALYKLLRKGEIRVDKKRAKPLRKLRAGEVIRLPPFKQDLQQESSAGGAPKSLLQTLAQAVMLEDEDIIILNKPSGIAVHGGTDNPHGVIEGLRELRDDLEYLELAHRIDRETSGLLLLAKNRVSLLGLHELFKNGGIEKKYQALVFGDWRGGQRRVESKLQRRHNATQKVVSDSEGKAAISVFTPLQRFNKLTLLEANIQTGRMHQIRVQLADAGYPIAGDKKYGDFKLNRTIRADAGLKRLFLHAYHVEFSLGHSGKRYLQTLTLPDELQATLTELSNG